MTDRLRRLLVATDGSASADGALSFAISIANEYGSHLALCYGLDYERAFAECSSVNGSVGLLEPLVHELEASAKSILADASKRTAAAGIDATSIVLNGSPAEAIAEHAAAGKFDAIVIGTTDKRGLDRFFLGSVADGVLQRTGVPIFVVPAAAGSSFALKRFLVAVDESEPSDEAAAFALDVAKTVHAHIIFVGVAETISRSDEAVLYGYAPAPMLEELRATTASRLAIETDRARTNGVAAESVVLEGAPAERILDLAQAHATELIIVGTHGRRGLPRLFLGSVAEAIVSRSRTPVAVVPARQVHAVDEASPSSTSVADAKTVKVI